MSTEARLRADHFRMDTQNVEYDLPFSGPDGRMYRLKERIVYDETAILLAQALGHGIARRPIKYRWSVTVGEMVIDEKGKTHWPLLWKEHERLVSEVVDRS